ncbi:MAG: hypothetical protein M1365_03255 [Actinobacteria bacterium]|nr:hypothetical protein [Actinomycetota bacterium]
MKNSDLDNIYVSESDTAKSKEILGDKAKGMTDDEIKRQVASIQFLADSWLDEYERSIFDGKTLNEKLAQ